ncbi:MAG: hypothetical protein BMS9Abin34_233 [Patescibacteria group bacterium]|nr:MAG: hypothetical protein BMS9Abin34_233 [Patescibacteria group bacterium]
MPRKRLKGIVKALSGAKTVRVEVVRVFHHSRYGKRIRKMKGYLAHFEGSAVIGQEVVIEGIPPISKRKHWRVVEIDGRSVDKKPRVESTSSPRRAEPSPLGGARRQSKSSTKGSKRKVKKKSK